MSDGAGDRTFKCAYPWQQMIVDLTGEVVPCCFWAGYGNTGTPLGNTNEHTVDEIWNGEGYRQLRADLSTGDLEGHPCGNCMAYRWGNGTFPRFSWPVGFQQEQGLCYFGRVPEKFDELVRDSSEPTILSENGVDLPHGDALHDDIRTLGEGRYSVWNGWVYFSSSDGSDPLSNGRHYVLRNGEHEVGLGQFVQDSQSGENLLKAYDEYVADTEVMTAEPSMISLISTADCNIDCPGCSQNVVRVTKVQHRPETVPAILSKIPYLSNFIWHGGEPYLIKRFREFVDQFTVDQNPNLTFGFTSNGMMITAPEVEKLKKFPRLNASVSIDSFDLETFTKIRKGANLKRVLDNVGRLLDLHDAPHRVFSVGMIICKSNMHELADNLRYAFDHDIGLNLSPVVLYPVTEQLNVFSDFERETAGWQKALDDASELVAQAVADNRQAVTRIDPSGMVEELRTIFASAKERYREVEVLNWSVHDPRGSLQHMALPGIIAYFNNEPLAYVALEEGKTDYELRIPSVAVDDHSQLNISVVHNMMEPQGVLLGKKQSFADWRRPTNVVLPEFEPMPRGRNIDWATYGESSPDGLNVVNTQEISDSYHELYKLDLTTARMEQVE